MPQRPSRTVSPSPRAMRPPSVGQSRHHPGAGPATRGSPKGPMVCSLLYEQGHRALPRCALHSRSGDRDNEGFLVHGVASGRRANDAMVGAKPYVDNVNWIKGIHASAPERKYDMTHHDATPRIE